MKIVVIIIINHFGVIVVVPWREKGTERRLGTTRTEIYSLHKLLTSLVCFVFGFEFWWKRAGDDAGKWRIELN